jgi:hypothetical protein
MKLTRWMTTTFDGLQGAPLLGVFYEGRESEVPAPLMRHSG